MGIDDDRLVDAASVSDVLRCGICHKVLQDPVYFAGRPCQDVFCRLCLQDFLAEQDPDDLPSCPVCGVTVELAALCGHLALSKLSGELKVRCALRCGWSGRLDACDEHMTSCPELALEAVRAELSESDDRIRELEASYAAQLVAQRARADAGPVAIREDMIRRLERHVSSRDRRIIEAGRLLADYEVRIAELEGQLQLRPSSSSRPRSAGLAERRRLRYGDRALLASAAEAQPSLTPTVESPRRGSARAAAAATAIYLERRSSEAQGARAVAESSVPWAQGAYPAVRRAAANADVEQDSTALRQQLDALVAEVLATEVDVDM